MNISSKMEHNDIISVQIIKECAAISVSYYTAYYTQCTAHTEL